MAQFAPAMLGGIYWKGGTRAGALAGLLAGFVVWLLHAAAARVRAIGLAADLTSSSKGLFGIALLKPHAAVRPHGPGPDHPLR